MFLTSVYCTTTFFKMAFSAADHAIAEADYEFDNETKKVTIPDDTVVMLVCNGLFVRLTKKELLNNFLKGFPSPFVHMKDLEENDNLHDKKKLYEHNPEWDGTYTRPDYKTNKKYPCNWEANYISRMPGLNEPREDGTYTRTQKTQALLDYAMQEKDTLFMTYDKLECNMMRIQFNASRGNPANNAVTQLVSAYEQLEASM